MMAAIDAVCDSARRIIGRIVTKGADEEAAVPMGRPEVNGDRPPTAKMRKFAASLAKRKGIRPPAGYTKSAEVCRAFLDQHAPRVDSGR